MRLSVDLTKEQFGALWHRAVKEWAFLREDPRKTWTEKERREAIAAWLVKKAEDERSANWLLE